MVTDINGYVGYSCADHLSCAVHGLDVKAVEEIHRDAIPKVVFITGQ
jgi:hypothetical protein